MATPHKGPGLLINHPLSHDRVFRMNRGRLVRTSNGRATFVKDPRWFEAVSCRAAQCEHYEHGWNTFINLSTDLGQRQAHYIRKLSGRAFREEKTGVETVTFHFEPEQKCFRPHELPIMRDPRFILRGRETSTLVDYDEFHTTFNETAVQIAQSRREV